MVLAVPYISALIRILNLTCLLANGQHQIFEKWPKWFRSWKLTVGQKAGQVQDPNQCKENWRNSIAFFIVNWHRWFIELMWGNAQMYMCICIYVYRVNVGKCTNVYMYKWKQPQLKFKSDESFELRRQWPTASLKPDKLASPSRRTYRSLGIK